MKKIFLAAIAAFAHITSPLIAFQDKPALSHSERVFYLAATFGTAYCGSVACSALGHKYIDRIVTEDAVLDLDLDLDDIDMNIDLDIDLDLSAHDSDEDSDDDGAGVAPSMEQSSLDHIIELMRRNGVSEEQIRMFGPMMGVATGAGAASAMNAETLKRMARQFARSYNRRGFSIPQPAAAAASTIPEDPKKIMKKLSDDQFINEFRRRYRKNPRLLSDFNEDDLIKECKRRFYDATKGYSMALNLVRPGSRVGTGVGFFAGYKLGKSWANKALAFRHGVSVNTELMCRFFNINSGQYKELIQAAEKKNIKAIKTALENLYVQRFGPDWRKMIYEVLYTFQNYGSFIVARKQKQPSEHDADCMRVIELGAAIHALYYEEKPTYKQCLESAREMYMILGFAPESDAAFKEAIEALIPADISHATQAICRTYGMYGDAYAELLNAAEKEDIVTARRCLEALFENRFGAEWRRKLQHLLNQYENYAHYLVKNKNHLFSDRDKDFLHMIEVGAAIYAVFEKKKPSYAHIVSDAHEAYCVLGLYKKLDAVEVG